MKKLIISFSLMGLLSTSANAGLLCAITQDPQVCAVGQALRGVGAAMQQAAPPPPVAPPPRQNTRCTTQCYNRAGRIDCQQICN